MHVIREGCDDHAKLMTHMSLGNSVAGERHLGFPSRYVGAQGGALKYFLGGYVPPGTPNWQPVLKKISPKIDTPF